MTGEFWIIGAVAVVAFLLLVILIPLVHTMQLQQAHQLENEKQRQEFSANVSHELKTPLTSILGYAEMIENGMAKDEDIKEFAGKIHTEASRLIDVIQDIIKLSEMDEKDDQGMFEPVEMLSVARSVKDKLEFSAQKFDVTLNVHGCTAIVMGKPRLLEDLIYNLCDNAIRYNKPGGFVTISVKNTVLGPSIRVKDNGIGIAKEHHDRIFERFYRADKSRSKATGGTGLGLGIVKHIVLIHRGKITLASEEGVGTEITVSFPAVEA